MFKEDYASTNLQGGAQSINRSFGTSNPVLKGNDKDNKQNNDNYNSEKGLKSEFKGEDVELFTINSKGENEGEIKDIEDEDDNKSVESHALDKNKGVLTYRIQKYLKVNGIQILNLLTYLIFIFLWVSSSINFRNIDDYYSLSIPFNSVMQKILNPANTFDVSKLIKLLYSYYYYH